MTDENPNVMPTNSNNPFIMKTTLEPLAPGHLGEIMLREIRQQWLNQQLVDYTLVTADGVEFRVHRSHIACFCDYISAMLSGEMRESREDRVTLEAVDSASLSPILDYIYGGSFGINSDNMVDVIQAARYLQIECVINMCARYICETLTLENLVHYSQVTERYGLDVLISEQQSVVDCLTNFSKTNFKEIMEHVGFSHLSYHVLKQVMSSNDLTCSELTVYNMISGWIQANPAQSVERKRNLVDCIYFLCMSKSVLSELKNSEEVSDNSYLFEKIDRALHYLDPDTSLAERLEIGTPAKLLRGPTSVIAIGGSPANPAEDSASDAVQVLMYDDSFSPDQGCWGWGQSGSIRPPYSRSSVASMDGMVFICGGQKRSDGEETLQITKNCYIFDPILWQLKEIASMNVPRTSFVLVACDGYLFAIGGVCNYPDPLDMCQTIERYSLSDNCWTTIGHLPEPKQVFAHAATSIGHLIYIYGGMDRFREEVDRFFSFDPLTGEWKTLPVPDSRRVDCALLPVDHWLILTRRDTPHVLMFDTNTEQWSRMRLLFNDLEESALGNIGVVNIVPVLSKEPALFYLGGNLRDMNIQDQEPVLNTNFYVPLRPYRGKPRGEIITLPFLKHNVIRTLCATVSIPPFRLETLRGEIIEEQRDA